jgi:hypothetical protein
MSFFSNGSMDKGQLVDSSGIIIPSSNTGLTISVNNQLYDSLYYPIKTQPIPSFGYRTVIINGSSNPTAIGAMIGGWAGTHPTQINPGTQVSFTVSSSNANDASGGTGLRSLTVYGLDASLNPISQTVRTNGTTSVTLDASYNHVNFIISEEAGSNRTAVGTVTVRSASTQYAAFSAASNASGWFKCPAGYKAVLTRLFFSANSASNCYITVWRKNKNTYDIHMRFQNQASIKLGNGNEALLILDEGDSCYMFQSSNIESFCIFIYQLFN